MIRDKESAGVLKRPFIFIQVEATGQGFMTLKITQTKESFDVGRYKVRKEPSPAKRCEKMRKERKRCEKSHVLWKKSRLCYIMHIEQNLDLIDVITNECQ